MQRENKRRCTKRTRKARLAAIRSLFAFITREESELVLRCNKSVLSRSNAPDIRPSDIWRRKKCRPVFDAVDIDARTGVHDRSMLLLLYNTGAHLSEAADLQLDDLRLDDAP